MNIAAQQIELAETFELVAGATERLLEEYALFVLEHDEVVRFLQGHLRTLEYDFEDALYAADYARAAQRLEDAQLLFGETQLKVNRGVIPSYEHISDATHSKTNV